MSVLFVPNDALCTDETRHLSAKAVNRLACTRASVAGSRLAVGSSSSASEVTADSADTVDLFRALLSLDLMLAFFQRDFLAAVADLALMHRATESQRCSV